MMRPVQIIREAFLNVTTGAGRALLAAVVLLATVGLGAVSISIYGSWVAREGQQFRQAGASTYVLRAENRIDPKRCERLSGLGAIRASGALRAKPDIVFAAMPSRTVKSFEASPDFWTVLKLGTPSAVFRDISGVWISSTLAQDIGVDPGDTAQLLNGPAIRVAGVFTYPDQVNNRELDYAVISPAVSQAAFSQCHIEAWPARQQDVSLLLFSLNAEPDSSLEEKVSAPLQLNTSRGKYFSADSQWTNAVQIAMVGAFIAGFVIGFSWVFSRRLVLSSNLHCGVDRRTLLLMTLTESALLLGFSCIVWLPIDWYCTNFVSTVDAIISFGAGGRVFLAGSAGFILGTAVGFTNVKESRLFDYFKAH